MAGKNPGEILTESLNESLPKIRARKGEFQMRMSTSVIGVGAGGGNIAHLMSDYDGYMTAAFNTTEADMIDLNVKHKIVIDGVNGSGKDRAFSAMEFKRSYKTFFEHPGIKELMKNDLIIIVGTGGGGTGTIISTMVAAYLKSEYPDKTIILIGILGSMFQFLIGTIRTLSFFATLSDLPKFQFLIGTIRTP